MNAVIRWKAREQRPAWAKNPKALAEHLRRVDHVLKDIVHRDYVNARILQRESFTESDIKGRLGGKCPLLGESSRMADLVLADFDPDDVACPHLQILHHLRTEATSEVQNILAGNGVKRAAEEARETALLTDGRTRSPPVPPTP